MSDYDDNRKSQFNAGVAMAERIDALQRAINAARFNPLAINESTGTYNFKIMIDAADGLFDEAWGKMNDKEKDKQREIKQKLECYMKLFPFIIYSKEGTKLNMFHFEKVFPLIDFYVKCARLTLDAHNFNSPDFDDDDGI